MIRSKRSVFAIESALRFDDPSRFAGIVNPTRLAGFAVGMLLLVLGCAPSEPASLNELASSALSQIGGELEVPGLKAPVEILRDEWGIPHIYAQNDDDLFMAQGYVMAQDRLWQMEMWRRWHEGRLSEIFGPEAFDYDKRTRQMMFRGPWDASEWTSYHPDGERIFTAYANGVNAFIEQNRDNLPVEFQLTGVEPERWSYAGLR
jgi:acyl-homoserine lactone acylase PvdQ